MRVKGTAGNGLTTVDKYYEDYGCRARELKREGRKIIGHLCACAPVEMITAAGFIPFRLKGDIHEPITKADSYMEVIVCPLIRSCFEASINGKDGFLDGLVVPHACDSISRTYDVWKYGLMLSYCHFVDIPRIIDEPSLEFVKASLGTFRGSLGKFAGKEISDASLIQAVGLYNQNRAKVRELYELRKSAPPLLTGAEVRKVLVAGMGIPVEESTELLSTVIDEVRARGGIAAKRAARIMVLGTQIDDAAFIDLVETSGAFVVADELCPGLRDNWSRVDITRDPMDGLAEYYLSGIDCPKNWIERTGTHQAYLEKRFGHIRRYIKDLRVDGVILCIYRCCDPLGWEVPQIKTYIEALDIPVLHLEVGYSMSDIGRLRTRVQAFLEMIG
jgi:benzoyl-CoA reductase subunit C